MEREGAGLEVEAKEMVAAGARAVRGLAEEVTDRVVEVTERVEEAEEGVMQGAMKAGTSNHK